MIFALCPDEPEPATSDATVLLTLEAGATRALELAIQRAVEYAVGRDGVPGLAD